MGHGHAYAQGTWFVAPGGSNSNDCRSPVTACATINGAIWKADSGDTIRVAIGTYHGAGDAAVDIDKNLTLSGGWDLAFAAQVGVSVIDGENARRGIEIKDSENISASADRFIVQNGFSSGAAGIYVGYGSSLTLSQSAILNNHATISGGGILVNYARLNLSNVTISGNTAPGIDVIGMGSQAVVTLSNSTLSNNWDNALTKDIGISTRATVIAQNTIFAGCDGAVTSQGYNLVTLSTDCSFTPATGDLIGIDAGLIPVVDKLGFFPLRADSPAIDAGNPNGCIDHLGAPLTTDQRNALRQGRCDIGAYEQVEAGPVTAIYILAGASQTATVLSNFPDPLQAVLVDDIGTPASNTTTTLTAPSSGASVTFEGCNTSTCTKSADASGIVTSTLIANTVAGHYTVTVSANSSVAHFDLTNILRLTMTRITSVRPNPSVIGWPVSVNFAVTATQGVPTGTVTVTVDEGTESCYGALSDGLGSCELMFQDAGVKNLRAFYENTGLYAGSEDTETHTVEEFARMMLPLIAKPYPIYIAPGNYPANRCASKQLFIRGTHVGLLTECVTSVDVRLDGYMQFNYTWMLDLEEGIPPVTKYSDEYNRNMYITDNLGLRYDHVGVGGAAAQPELMEDNIPLYGWFLFVPAQSGAHTFVFHDDDQGFVFDGIQLGP
jgi:hypothetical protein